MKKTFRDDRRGMERFTRPPLERMMQIHAQLRSNAYPNCRKLAERLEVSSKTIQRDIDFMRYRLSLPVEYDAERFGFYYSEAVTGFPNMDVSEGEIAALFVAQKALTQYEGTPYEKPLRSAFRKITASLRDRVTFPWDDIDEVISFHSVGASVADIELFEIVSQAVLKSVELQFDYRKLESKTFEARRVRPLHIAALENQWYLFAEDLDREQLRTFALPRMRKARATSVRFRRPADFSISDVLSGSFGVFAGKKRYQIRLRFDEFAGRLVAERRWHDSQRLTEQADGSVVLQLQLGGLEEIERWVLSWGSHVRVLEPPELVRLVKSEADAVAALYDNGKPRPIKAS